jgi:energy-converting hydrogenase Eha subunit F
MRKLILAVIALLGFTLSTSAQQAPKKVDKAKTEAKKPEAKKEETKVVLKKDGTPDKRFKENKETKVVLKKDGTPDKRFNKGKK